MAKIKPFRAVIYNQEKIKDLSDVVCPPYDVISPKDQQHYHEKNPHNLIRILLGNDVTGEDKYQRAADYFEDWLKNKILIRDEKPCIYFYSQDYTIKGEKRTRLGFISLLRLGEKDSAVYGHENTQPAPKEDRLKVLKQVKANLSPIFAIFLDKNRIIQRSFQRYIKTKEPFIHAIDKEKTVHKIWRIDSPDTLTEIQSSMAGENIFIADGHHRYEVACVFKDEMKKKLGDTYSGEEDFNYILTYFTNTDPRGLMILPVHRLVKLDKDLDLESFKIKLKDYFELEEVKDKTRFFFLIEKGGTEHVLGMYKDKRYWLLRLKNIKILDKVMSDKPEEYRSLDVSILNSLVLKKILTENPEDNENIAYSPCAQDFIERVDSNPSYAAFFLTAVKIRQLIALALKGERMPSKSTYFYPKVLSGLLINKFQ